MAFEVRRAVLDEQSARESLKAAQAQLRAAARALEATEQRYEAGASTLHEVTLSRADLVQARSARVSAAYTLLWQKHVREYYVGTLEPGGEAHAVTLPAAPSGPTASSSTPSTEAGSSAAPGGRDSALLQHPQPLHRPPHHVGRAQLLRVVGEVAVPAGRVVLGPASARFFRSSR